LIPRQLPCLSFGFGAKSIPHELHRQLPGLGGMFREIFFSGAVIHAGILTLLIRYGVMKNSHGMTWNGRYVESGTPLPYPLLDTLI
jgi:hypothetical protein